MYVGQANLTTTHFQTYLLTNPDETLRIAAGQVGAKHQPSVWHITKSHTHTHTQ